MRYKATVMYNGSAYNGWQIQKNQISIQETIQKVIYKITNFETKITASGRTDTGVHALGQVFHFDSILRLQPVEWKKALNALLPPDIRILSVEEVTEDFHARFDVKEKTYRYLLNMGEFDPFTYPLIYQYGNRLDIEKMKECLTIFIGRHDFTSFCANKKEEVEDQVRTIYDIGIQEENGIVSIEFSGEGFLRYMIRMIVGTLIKVGEGKLSYSEVQRILTASNKEACSYNAPACGLYLVEVRYEDEV